MFTFTVVFNQAVAYPTLGSGVGSVSFDIFRETTAKIDSAIKSLIPAISELNNARGD